MLIKIATALENTEGFNIINRIFTSSSNKSKDIISNLGNFINVEEADFSKNENTFTVYVNKYGNLRYHEFSSKTEYIFANICTFESRWQLNKRSNLETKLYNSYNYADDIRYEGRLLELPLRSEEFKLVIVLPNENDVLNTLFATLTNQGLSAAVSSIQPLFTDKSVLATPTIDVTSRIQIKEKINAISNGLAIQYGTVAVSDIGTQLRVLTCLYLPASTAMEIHDGSTYKPGTPPPPPFYFALVYNDTPIFYGDFNKRIVFPKYVRKIV